MCFISFETLKISIFLRENAVFQDVEKNVPFQSGCIFRWTVERYRFEICLFGMDYVVGKFRQFLRPKALVLKLGSGGAPMKLSTSRGISDSIEVHVRLVEAKVDIR